MTSATSASNVRLRRTLRRLGEVRTRRNGGQSAAQRNFHVFQRTRRRERQTVPRCLNGIVLEGFFRVPNNLIQSIPHCHDSREIREYDAVILTSAFDNRRISHLSASQPAFLAIEHATTGLTARCRGNVIMPRNMRVRVDVVAGSVAAQIPTVPLQPLTNPMCPRLHCVPNYNTLEYRYWARLLGNGRGRPSRITE